MKAKEIDLTDGSRLFRNLVAFITPVMLSGLLQLLYNASDLIVCGSFGSEHATAAISSTTSLINLIVNFFLGLSVGANVVMARCYGEKNKEKGERVVYTSIAISVVAGVALGAFGAGLSRYFLIWMKTPSEVLHLSTQYLAVYFLGVPFMLVYNFGASLLRAVGETRRPFYFLALAGAVNVALNLLFVIVFRLDVLGVAICTDISQVVSAALTVWFIRRYTGFFRFRFKKIRFYGKEAGEILRVGLPSGISGTAFSLSNVIIQSSINSLGVATVGGNGAACSLEGFVYTAMNSAAVGTTSFVSANCGARNRGNIRRTVLYSMLIALVADIVLGGAVLLARRLLLGLYVKTDEEIACGVARLFIILPLYFMCGWMDVMSYANRAMGFPTISMIVSVAGSCGIRFLWVYAAFPYAPFHSLPGLAWSYPVSWGIVLAIQFACFMYLYRKRLNFDDPPAVPPAESSDGTRDGVSERSAEPLSAELAATAEKATREGEEAASEAPAAEGEEARKKARKKAKEARA